MNPTLHLVDPATGEVVADPREARIAELEARVQELTEAVAHEAVVNSNLRSQISRMRGERIERAKADPLTERAMRLCELWKDLCNHRRCQIDDARLDPVVKALRRREADGIDMDEAEALLRRPIFGAGLFPYVTKEGRAKQGKPRERHDDLTLIFRNEEKIANFTRLAQAEAEHVLGAMVRPLVHAYGKDVWASHDAWSGEVTAWHSPCPVCNHGTWTLELQVAFSAERELVRLRCSSGCEPPAVRGRLREMCGEMRAA